MVSRQNFAHTLFHHHVIFGCFFLIFLARMYEATKIYGRLFRDFWNRASLTTKNTLLHDVSYHTNFDHSLRFNDFQVLRTRTAIYGLLDNSHALS